jgi:hypothetical protein
MAPDADTMGAGADVVVVVGARVATDVSALVTGNGLTVVAVVDATIVVSAGTVVSALATFVGPAGCPPPPLAMATMSTTTASTPTMDPNAISTFR